MSTLAKRAARGLAVWAPALAALLLAAGADAQQGRKAQPLAGKPVAPFTIEHEVLGTPAIGIGLELRVTLRSQLPVRDVTVQLSADAGLDVGPTATLAAASAGPDAPAVWRITVVPLADGVQRLRLYGEADVDGRRQGRSVVIPIRVGADDEAPDADPEPLIRLPASELR